MAIELEPEPEPKKKRKYTRRAKSDIQSGTDELVRLALLTAINSIVQTGFSITAMLAKDNKWKLQNDESAQLAKDVDAALALLPDTQYEIIIKYLSTVAPLASLATTLSAIIKRRLDSSTVKSVARTSEASTTSTSPSEPRNPESDWRFNSAYAINGVNH